MPIVNLKRERQHSFTTEMAVFTLETGDSRETGYSFDNLRHISHTS